MRRARPTILSLGAVLAALPASAMAQDAGAPWLWAAPALYGFESGACDPASAAEASVQGEASMVAPLFCPQLGIAERREIGASFARAVAAHFAQVEPGFGAHLPAAAPEARLRGTLAVSLRLTRASYSTVTKPVGVDAYLPVTLTLDITNPATGEVVFTRTRNAVAEGAYPAETLKADLARQFAAHLEATMQVLVAEAGAAFRPYAQTAKVLGSVPLGRDGTAYVVDKGRNAGLRAGDGLGQDAVVAYAGPDYAVVRAVLGGYREGQQLSRVAAAPVEALARPSVLTVVEQAPEDYAPAWLSQILEDALGSGTALSPVPVNRAFVALRLAALDGAGADLAPEARALPDFVASVRLVVLDPVRRPSEIPGVTMEHHEALAFVTLVDRSGRAVGAWQGRGAIEDKVTGNIRMSLSQRREAMVRNALMDAAKQMGAFRPQPLSLPLSRRDGAIVVADLAGAAPLGLTLPVLRPAGRFSGVAGPVLVPVGEVTTREAVAGGVLAADAGVEPLSLRGGEVVALEAAGVPPAMRQSVGQCLGADGRGVMEDRGQVPMTTFAAAAPGLLAGRMAAPVRVATLAPALASAGRSFEGWDRFGAARAPEIAACFVPVIAVVPDATGYRVTVGYTLHRGASAGGPKIGASGLAVKLTPTRLPDAADAEARAAMLQSDLAAQVLPIAGSAAAALRIAP